MVGCVGLWLVLNLMSRKGMEMSQTCSILGYCLLPMVFLALASIVLRSFPHLPHFFIFEIFFSCSGIVLYLVGALFVAWCVTRAASMFIAALATADDDMKNQRWLVAYPVGLFYGCFALMAVF